MINENIKKISFYHATYYINTSAKSISKSCADHLSNQGECDPIIHSHLIMTECLDFLHQINSTPRSYNSDKQFKIKMHLMNELNKIKLQKSDFFKKCIDQHFESLGNFKEHMYKSSLEDFVIHIELLKLHDSLVAKNKNKSQTNTGMSYVENENHAKALSTSIIKKMVNRFQLDCNTIHNFINTQRPRIPNQKPDTFLVQLLKFILRFVCSSMVIFLHFTIMRWFYPCTPLHIVILQTKVSVILLGLALSILITLIWHMAASALQLAKSTQPLTLAMPLQTLVHSDQCCQQLYHYLNQKLEQKHPEYALKSTGNATLNH